MKNVWSGHKEFGFIVLIRKFFVPFVFVLGRRVRARDAAATLSQQFYWNMRMLSEQDKQRILLEETYRDEVRRSLSPSQKQTGLKRVWGFLNSQFGMWFISAVIMGLVTNYYARIVATAQSEAVREQRVRDLDLEISERLDSVNIIRWGDRILDKNGFPTDLVDRVLLPPGEKNTIVYDLRNRTLRSLLFELKGFVLEIEKEKIAEALFILDGIRNVGTEDRQQFVKIIEDIGALRWFTSPNVGNKDTKR